MSQISVIIPNYNHADFLKQRIDSVLQQTYQDFEVIILDDRSTDNSRDIIDYYKKHPKIFSIIYNEDNSGSVFKQWIKGIELARGEYIWIAESDDYASLDFLDQTVKILKDKNDCGLVFTNSFVVDENSHISDETGKKLSLSSKIKNNVISKVDIEKSFINDMLISNVSCCLFKKSILLSVNFHELMAYKSAGDRFAYIGVALNTNIFYLSPPLNFFRNHKKNTTKSNVKKGITFLERFNVLAYYIDKLELSSFGKEEIKRFLKFHFLLFIDVVDNEKIDALLQKLSGKSIISTKLYFFLYIYLKTPKRLRTPLLQNIVNYILHKF